MRIVDVAAVAIDSGFYADDQAAIRAGAKQDNFAYPGTPITPGFSRIREPGRAVSVLLRLEDGQVAQGDCAEVQYAAAGGRDTPLRLGSTREQIEQIVRPQLMNREVRSFSELAEMIDVTRAGRDRLHSAVRYGATQALLDAVAKASCKTMAEIIRSEYDTKAALRIVPVFAQSGDSRYENVDKMVLKKVDALPHGLINNVETKLGADGEILLDYVRWVRERVLALRDDPQYAPVLHFDVYGTIGIAFARSTTKIASYLQRLEAAAAPFAVRIEQPVDAGSTDAQIDAMARLRESLRARGSHVQIVADEWCNTLEDIGRFAAAGAADVIHVKTPDLGGLNNTVEALLTVRAAGLGAYCGGTCNETDQSARICAQVAMACAADLILAKPGMGVDEGVMITRNEMAKTLAAVQLTARAVTA